MFSLTYGASPAVYYYYYYYYYDIIDYIEWLYEIGGLLYTILVMIVISAVLIIVILAIV